MLQGIYFNEVDAEVDDKQEAIFCTQMLQETI